MMPRGVSRMVRGKEQERTETRSRLRSIYNSDRVYDSAIKLLSTVQILGVVFLIPSSSLQQ